jgi:integrase
MAKINGLYQDTLGYWRYQPSRKGLPKGIKAAPAVSLGTKDQAEALRRLVQDRRLELAQVASGDVPVRRLGEWVRAYIEDRLRTGRYSVRTASQAQSRLELFTQFTGDADPSVVTRVQMMEFYGYLQIDRTHATVHQCIRYVRALFYWLLEHQVVKGNPAARLRLPVVRQTRRDQFCTAEERGRILEACPESLPELRFVFMAGFYLGMRINEIVNCRWNWFHGGARNGHCVIQSEAKGGTFETKTRGVRTVPLHPVFVDYLAGLERGRVDDYVIKPAKQQGKQWLRWDPRHHFDQVVASCGLEWVTPHTMRHTFGSLHAMAGTPELKIRRWMGITQATLDRHYAGLSPDDADVGAI